MNDLLLSILVALISSGTVTTIVTTIFKSVWETHLKKDPQRTAVRMLLQRQIEQECIRYLQDGSIPYSKLRLIRNEHDCYHNGLGGNGDLDALMNDLENLPVIYDEKI